MHTASIRILKMTAFLLLAASLLTPSGVEARPGRTEVIIEGGALMPLGDLEAGNETPEGFAAELGFDVGFRYRQLWPSGWAISPSFHYAKLGKYTGQTTADEDFERGTSMFRYGVDVQYFFPSRRQAPRFFLTGGAAIIRNRMREDYADDSYFEAGANSLSLTGGLGMRQGDFEFSVNYHLNRYSSSRFWDDVDDYNWDYVTLRVGFALPNYD
jgi:hypothetical protein